MTRSPAQSTPERRTDLRLPTRAHGSLLCQGAVESGRAGLLEAGSVVGSVREVLHRPSFHEKSSGRIARTTKPVAVGMTPSLQAGRHPKPMSARSLGASSWVMVRVSGGSRPSGRTGQARMASAARPTPTMSRTPAGQVESENLAVLPRPAPETGPATAQVRRRSCGTFDRA